MAEKTVKLTSKDGEHTVELPESDKMEYNRLRYGLGYQPATPKASKKASE